MKIIALCWVFIFPLVFGTSNEVRIRTPILQTRKMSHREGGSTLPKSHRSAGFRATVVPRSLHPVLNPCVVPPDPGQRLLLEGARAQRRGMEVIRVCREGV